MGQASPQPCAAPEKTAPRFAAHSSGGFMRVELSPAAQHQATIGLHHPLVATQSLTVMTVSRHPIQQHSIFDQSLIPLLSYSRVILHVMQS